LVAKTISAAVLTQRYSRAEKLSDVDLVVVIVSAVRRAVISHSVTGTRQTRSSTSQSS